MFIKFKFYAVDLKKFGIFCFKNKFKSIGFFLIYKICAFSGVSFSVKLNFFFIPLFTIQCIKYTLTLLNSFEILQKNLKKFKKRILYYKNLKSFLFKNFLPCNGQRAKTNAQTAKKRRLFKKK